MADSTALFNKFDCKVGNTPVQGPWRKIGTDIDSGKFVVVQPIIHAVTVVESTCTLALEISETGVDDDAFEAHKWTTFGGYNVTGTTSPFLPRPFTLYTPYGNIRATATITGTSAIFNVTMLAMAVEAPANVRGAAFFYDSGEITVATSATEIIPPLYVGDLIRYAIYGGNKTGGAQLTACKVEHAGWESSYKGSPDYALISTDTSTYGTLAAGASAKLLRDQQEDAYMRVGDATCGTSTTARFNVLGTFKG